MPLVRVDPAEPDPGVLQHAAELLRQGGLVAFPTETVYGLGANALDGAAVQRIFTAKGRPSYNPLIAHVPDAATARELAREWPADAERLAAAFWPGPLTLVVPKRRVVPDAVTAGLPTVALRVPAHPVAKALLQIAGIPLAAPSANRFTEISPTSAQHVLKGLGDRVDLIIDGGPTMVGIESTVVDCSGGRPILLRPGTIAIEELQALVGPFDTASLQPSSEAPRPSPGMIGRHYAPRAELRLFDGPGGEALELARRFADAGRAVGALLLGSPHPSGVQVVQMPLDPGSYARRLYAALHFLDEQQCDVILVENVPSTTAWAGVRDRLQRAAHAPSAP
jgi:L-threonylcarbamoyladenylate synthase